MRKTINTTSIQGYLYEHNLEEKITGPSSKNPGTPFIAGTISIATDEACMNVVQVHFSYITEVTSKGRTNATYTILKNIVDGKLGSVMEHGKDMAAKLRIDSSLDLNEWYDREGNFISVKRNEGGFVHTTNELSADESMRAQFTTDMIITGCTRIEANEERNLPERLAVKGAIFGSFRGELLPVEYTATNPEAMDYFEGLEPSNQHPVFTKVWGRQISQTVTRTITEESAFGAPSIREVRSSRKDFEITGASPEPYEFDVEGSITAAELKELMQQREIHKAEIKKRQDDYQSKRASAFAAVATSSTNNGGYDF